MIGVNKTKSFLIIFLFTMSMLFNFGCGSNVNNKADGAKIVAIINDYHLTANDFREEANITYPSMYLSQSGEEEKEELLDDIITKKILLQEAQKQNFDKDRAFMKEIERYWEQALLKLLIQKKTQELAKNINITEKEVRDEYNTFLEESGEDFGSYEEKAPVIKRYILQKKIQKELNDWVGDLKDRSNIEVNKELLTEIKLNTGAEE